VSPFRLSPAAFLDRDGVIVENRADYVKSIGEVRFIPGALAALAQAAPLDFQLVVVTNQSVIGRGQLTEPASAAINAYVHQQIVAAGGRIDGWYVCPHLPEAGCACRKPKPGMLLSAAADLGIDLPASVMIGDALSDVLAGHAAGTHSIMVRTGLGSGQTGELARAGLDGVLIVPDLAAALERFAAGLLFTKTPPDGGAVIG
jgi:D-glycero-D-manno-heptose 1,7-bisphosphate phosphatase